MNQIKLLMLATLVLISAKFNVAFGQSTAANNTYNAANYLGWSSSNTLPFKLNGTTYMTLSTAGDWDVTNTGNGITLAGSKLLFTKGSNTNLCVGITAGNAQGTSQGDNTFAGYQSGYNTNGNIAATTGMYNTFIGSNSAFTNTACCNNAHGFQSLYKNTSGYANVAIGVSASYSNTTGAYNMSMGDSALQTNTTGGLNVALGYKALYSNTTASRNNAIGYRAMGSNTTASGNDAFGNVALFTNTTGTQNDAFGDSCMYSNNGTGNAALGYRAMRANTSGNNNMAFGASALSVNTSGAQNAAIGFATLASNTTTSGNVGIGYEALLFNTGTGNVGIGVVAAINNTTGDGITYVGDHAGDSNTSGDFNTGVGQYSGATVTTADSNTFVGAYADANSTAHSNCGAFGAYATATADKMIRIGNSNITVIQGQVGFTTSDGRFKTNVQENVKGLDFIKRLRPVTYKLKPNALDNFMRTGVAVPVDSNGQAQPQANGDFLSSVQSGLIAQEVEQAAADAGFSTNIVHHPENTYDPYGISYEGLVVPLIKAVQEQQKMIDSLQTQINVLNGGGSRKQQDDGSIGSTKNSTTVELTDVEAIVLNPAVPNPFAEQTVITYNVPEKYEVAQILFYDFNGRLIKAVDITKKGKGQLNVIANDLTNGVYTYSLIVDGKVHETKKMVKQN